MENILLCPMQSRMDGVRISECPKFLEENATNDTHTIQVWDPDDLAETLTIPLMLDGVISYFPARVPTIEEYENEELPHFTLTAQDPPWDPASSMFQENEEALTDYRGQIIVSDTSTRGRGYTVASAQSAAYDVVDITDQTNFGTALENAICVTVSQVETSKRKNKVDHITLAQRWAIPPSKAKKTVQVTTQRGIRTIAHPSLSRRFRTNDRQLRYRRLPSDMYTDTMFSKVPSQLNDKCAQVFATDFGWARAHPMKAKADAHEALSLLFHKEMEFRSR